ncbi:MAG: putative collagen-binding domain-containing protein, partial [Saprospiraceae bacterium]|nr:putative collagen-binding domain-containing protein [Saprospiraceae bacterium]
AVIGVPHDDYLGINPDQHDIRKQVLWGNLMAGGAGVEYYFGYALPHDDLVCEDFRSRSRMWEYNRHAVRFFHDHLPFWVMSVSDSLIVEGTGNTYCFSLPGELYAVYLPQGGSAQIDLSAATGVFSVSWFDPVEGGQLQSGSVSSVTGGTTSEIGEPPAKPGQDWVALVQRQDGVPEAPALDIAPAGCLQANLIAELPGGVEVDLEWSYLDQPFATLHSITLDPGTPRTIWLPVNTPHALQHYRLRIHTANVTYFSQSVAYRRPCSGSGLIQTDNAGPEHTTSNRLR